MPKVNHRIPGFSCAKETLGKPWSKAEALDFERYLQEEVHLSAHVLMENAGNGLARAIQAILDDQRWNQVLFLIGPGNNGGDGLVAARQLQGAVSGQVWAPLGLPPYPSCDDFLDSPPNLPEDGILIVDALFGIGLNRPIQGAALQALQHLRTCGLPVLAVDTPSGLDSDSGETLGFCLPARWTLTFVAPKIGFGLVAGPESCGAVHVAPIGVSREFAEAWRR